MNKENIVNFASNVGRTAVLAKDILLFPHTYFREMREDSKTMIIPTAILECTVAGATSFAAGSAVSDGRYLEAIATVGFSWWLSILGVVSLEAGKQKAEIDLIDYR